MSSALMLDVVLPAAGIGSRMQAEVPKQYLKLFDVTIIEHTLAILLRCPYVAQVIVALHPKDTFFSTLTIARDPRIVMVIGGDERVDSVLAGLQKVRTPWVLVHDAARPCLSQADLSQLLELGTQHPVGAILARPVVDTMKRCNEQGEIIKTVCRQNLWHALTPQLFKTQALMLAIKNAQQQKLAITDEASAMELSGFMPLLVAGSARNIKVTCPEDLPEAEAYLHELYASKVKGKQR